MTSKASLLSTGQIPKQDSLVRARTPIANRSWRQNFCGTVLFKTFSHRYHMLSTGVTNRDSDFPFYAFLFLLLEK
jgi:hypothetical protein